MKATVQCFTDPSAFNSLRAEWMALEKRLSPRTPFSGPLWLETWWSHLRRDSWYARDDLALFSVRDQAGQLIAMAPYMHTKRPGSGPVRLIELHALGADPHVTELRGVICHPNDQPVVMQALKECFSASGPRPTWITWHNVRWCEGAHWTAPTATAAANSIWMRAQPTYIVNVPDNWAAFEASLTKRVRKKIRHCNNLLHRDSKQVTLSVVSDPDAVNEAVRTFYDLVAVRSEVRHANPFGAADVRAFFDDYAQRSARQGELRIFQLRCGGDVVASRIGFALERELYLYHSGNLPAWDRYSIMTTLQTEMFKWAIKNGFELVNLSTGFDRSKARWRPREIMFVDAIEIMPGHLNSALYHTYTRIKSARQPVPKDPFEVLGGQVSLPKYDATAELPEDL